MDRQPIETAPKDVRILLFADKYPFGFASSVQIGFWRPYEERWSFDSESVWGKKAVVTHWMPLPKPPIEGTK